MKTWERPENNFQKTAVSCGGEQSLINKHHKVSYHEHCLREDGRHYGKCAVYE